MRSLQKIEITVEDMLHNKQNSQHQGQRPPQQSYTPQQRPGGYQPDHQLGGLDNHQQGPPQGSAGPQHNDGGLIQHAGRSDDHGQQQGGFGQGEVSDGHYGGPTRRTGSGLETSWRLNQGAPGGDEDERGYAGFDGSGGPGGLDGGGMGRPGGIHGGDDGCEGSSWAHDAGLGGGPGARPW
ncbi:hypothetical protein DOTSEDRAFT_23703 [Dothistroma septosporum NZE10]|uniref:Uncharacterized protein n=1 Tax=Dothistroma septosporum (strain NZE10 / CBS 128990) TaxID=675120 RepID=N1PQP8_DOTSN|nr:hypothetical protein DOTSEDRAFT_23703 [Dothistroma septosporum NZE10]